MAKATLCDRCECFEEGEPVADVMFSWPRTKGTGVDSKNYELCAHCLVSLQDWIEMRVISRSEADENV